jgi:hypothetical protein
MLAETQVFWFSWLNIHPAFYFSNIEYICYMSIGGHHIRDHIWRDLVFNGTFKNISVISWCSVLLAHLTQRVMWAIVTTERPSSVVRQLTFYILINSSEATGPIWTKLWWNGPWMAPFQNCVRWSRLPTKMATKLKIEKRGDEILIVHCCFSISQNELKF